MADNKALADDLDLVWHSVSDDRETHAAYERLKAALTATPSAQAGEVEPFGHYFRDVEGMDRFHRGPRAPGFAQSDITPLYTTPQPQGDASPEGSGGGEFDLLVKYGQHLEECRGSASRDCTCGLDAAIAAALTPRAQEPAPYCAVCDNNREVDTEADPTVRPCPKCSEPAPTADGGAVAWVPAAMLDPRVMENFYTASRFQVARDSVPLYTHPTPAPDVARLMEALEKLASEWEGDNKWDAENGQQTAVQHICIRQLREALAPFTAAQPKEEG